MLYPWRRVLTCIFFFFLDIFCDVIMAALSQLYPYSCSHAVVVFWFMTGGRVAQEFWECLYFACQDADLIRFIQSSQLHHKDHSIWKGSQHSKLNDYLGWASSNFHWDGKEKPHWNLELYKPRCGEPQWDSGDVSAVHRPQLHLEKFYLGWAGKGDCCPKEQQRAWCQ